MLLASDLARDRNQRMTTEECSVAAWRLLHRVRVDLDQAVTSRVVHPLTRSFVTAVLSVD